MSKRNRKKGYNLIAANDVLAAKIPDVAEAYRQGVPTNEIIRRFNLGNPYSLYRMLATAGVQYREKNPGNHIPTKGGKDRYRVVRHRHRYSPEEDQHLVNQYLACAKDAEKRGFTGIQLPISHLMRFFPAKTSTGAIIGRLRRLGYPASAWKDALKAGPVIPGPFGWKYLNQESKGKKRRVPDTIKAAIPVVTNGEPEFIDIKEFIDVMQDILSLGFTHIGR